MHAFNLLICIIFSKIMHHLLSSRTVVSLLIPIGLAIAVLIFCVVCYIRKKKEKKRTENGVSAEERLKENSEPNVSTMYQNGKIF